MEQEFDRELKGKKQTMKNFLHPEAVRDLKLENKEFISRLRNFNRSPSQGLNPKVKVQAN